jgi:hypothetical protein
MNSPGDLRVGLKREREKMTIIQYDILRQFCLTEEEVCNFREVDVGLAGIDITHVSWFLSAQLAYLRKSKEFSSFSVTDVIQRLEGREKGSSTKSPQQFKHYPMKGFWKAHFVDARFIVRNLVNEWGLEFNTSPKFEELCRKADEEEAQCPGPLGWQGRLAHEFVIEGYMQRVKKRKLTGEWLIFAELKLNAVRYYLGITTHSNNSIDDQRIYDCIFSACGNEYPFLFDRTTSDQN